MYAQIKHGIALAALAIGLLASATSLNASTMMSAHELYISCKAKWADKAYLERYAACRGYISGIADTLKHPDPSQTHRVCIPAGATKGQVFGAVVGFLRSQHYERPGPNPDKSAESVDSAQLGTNFEERFRSKSVRALDLVLEILAQKFPCN